MIKLNIIILQRKRLKTIQYLKYCLAVDGRARHLALAVGWGYADHERASP
jgi:hypothetical protein